MCDRCKELEEELRSLRKDLAYELDQTLAAELRTYFSCTHQQANILSVLYRAGGRYVPASSILEVMNSRSESPGRPSLVRVQICHLRTALGLTGVIENNYHTGYRLTKFGLAVVRRAISKAAA